MYYKKLLLVFYSLETMYNVVVQLISCDQLCYPTNCRMLGFPVLHYLPAFAQIHVH